MANQNAALGRAVLKIPTMVDRMNPANNGNLHNKPVVVLPPQEPLKNLSSLVPGNGRTKVSARMPSPIHQRLPFTNSYPTNICPNQ